MTTKPKAKKFRIRRSTPLSAQAAEATTATVAAAEARMAAAGQPAAPVHAGAGAPQARPPVGEPPRDPYSGPLPDRQPAPAAAPPQEPARARRPAPVSAEAPVSVEAPVSSPAPARPAPAAARQGGERPAAPRAPSPDRGRNNPHAHLGPVTLDEIHQEGLTGRQLRLARRLAQKHGMEPATDHDAVRMLRLKGIDPFQRSSLLELMVRGRAAPDETDDVDDDGARMAPIATIPLPADAAPAPAPNTLPAVDMSPAERRSLEITAIQRDITRRRRERMRALFMRLCFFVVAPTILVAFYFFAIATPMYTTKSEFLIIQADNQGGSGFGNLLSGTQFATVTDAIAVQSYLESKDAMLRLDADLGFKTPFSQEYIDPIQRLTPNPSNEQAYKAYRKFVKIGYDPTEGVVKLEVIAPEPQMSADFSNKLISYAEERVDDLSRRKRVDSMKTARENLERAKQERRDAQLRLVKLQESEGVDPTEQLAALRGQISSVQVQLQDKQLQLQALLDNPRPNQAKVDGTRGDIRRLENLKADLDSQMTEAITGETSLAAKAVQIQMAKADLATADMIMQSALTNEKQTASEVDRQVRYLTTSVRPVAPEDPSYPRAFEDTILAFLIFSGIYLMLSLTASVLREQVSS